MVKGDRKILKHHWIEDDIEGTNYLEKAKRRKERFDKFWKIALIIILTISICYMFYEWNNINKEAMACRNAPFVWGVEKAKERGIFCIYYCSFVPPPSNNTYIP